MAQSAPLASLRDSEARKGEANSKGMAMLRWRQRSYFARPGCGMQSPEVLVCGKSTTRCSLQAVGARHAAACRGEVSPVPDIKTGNAINMTEAPDHQIGGTLWRALTDPP